MSGTEKKPLLNTVHILMGCRFDVWLRLLIQNRFRIAPRCIPQALLITGTSLLLFPFALLERLVCWLPVRRSRVRQPLFILGHWRSGTTFLQNLLSQDSSWGWFEPVAATMFNNASLLGWLLRPLMRTALPSARPMDNMVYTNDLPMEEVFAICSSSILGLDLMLPFPQNYEFYLDSAFVDELPEKQRRSWRRTYDYILRKQTWRCGGRPLMLKSPDATCRALELYRMYPDARFVHIYRNPYKVLRSTINMFTLLLDSMALQEMPYWDRFNEMLVDVFARIMRKAIDDIAQLPPEQVIEIRYEDFEQDPMAGLQKIYKDLGLSGFEQAAPRFKAYIDSQKNYQKNRFDEDPALIRRINETCGFYFEHYGYPMKEV